MSFRIRRRRFGQLVVASAAATAITNLTGKAVAQQSPPAILGLRLSEDNTSSGIANNISNVINTTPAVVLVSSNLTTGSQLSVLPIPANNVANLPDFSQQIANGFANQNQAVSIQPRERLTALTSLSGGTVVAASVINSNQGNVTRVLFTNTQSSQAQKSLIVSGFKQKNSTVESLLATKDGTLIAVVSLNGGIPPFQLVTIDPNTGIINSSDNLGLPQLPPFLRVSNLTQSPDGTIYATTLGPQGVTNLVQLDLNNKSSITGKGIIRNLSPLILNNQPLQNDLLSLAVSPSNQLFALADPNSQGTNFLHSLNVSNGQLTQLREFDVDQIGFAGS